MGDEAVGAMTGVPSGTPGPIPAPEPPNTSSGPDLTSSRQVRGSTVLLAGRFVNIGLDLITQVLLVRYLSKGDFGAFAFALAVVSLASSASVLGLDKTITRFAPFYEERNDRGGLVGSLLLAFFAILGVGISIVLVLIGLQDHLTEAVVENRQARDLLLILILLAPIQALDSVLIGLLAVFAGPRAVFLRRYLLAPGLQLLVVLLLTATGSSVELLGIGYVAAGAVGVALFGVVLVRLLGKRGMLSGIRDELRFPVREIFGFSLPLVSSDLVLVLRSSLVVLMLQYIATSTDVAEYRAVVPLARQNMLVFQVFGVLFLPAIARLLARNQEEQVNDLYWRTATWIAVMTFPIFAVSFALAEPLVVLLYGERYASSGPILAVLALGQYAGAVLGFNALTLRAYARVRYIVTVDLVTALTSVLVLLVAIREFGAIGAAVATSGTLVLQNVLYQMGLARGSSVRAFDRRRLETYALIAGLAAALAVVQAVFGPPFLVMLGLAALASLLVLTVNRQALMIGEAFPELLRVPVARRFLGGSPQ